MAELRLKRIESQLQKELAAMIQRGEIKDPRALNPLLAVLCGQSDQARYEAAEALGKMKELSLGKLIRMIKNEDVDQRRNAVLALAEIKDPRAVESLIDALRDEAEGVRQQTAFSLGELKEPRAVEALAAALQDEADNVRENAARALGQIKDPRAVGPLVKALADDAAAQEVSVALAAIGKPAVEPLLAALRDKDEGVRSYAATTLGEIKDPRAVGPLIRTLADEEEDVGESAADALAEIKGPAVEPLVVALKDENPDVRWWAASVLGKIKDARAVEPLLGVLQDQDPKVRQKAAAALQALTGQDLGEDVDRWREWQTSSKEEPPQEVAP
jgi:HEAT repeat protein